MKNIDGICCTDKFKNFLNFLFKSFKKWLPFRKAHLLYHISFRLSRGISKFFEIFYDFFWVPVCPIGSLRQLIYYIIILGLCQPFLHVFANSVAFAHHIKQSFHLSQHNAQSPPTSNKYFSTNNWFFFIEYSTFFRRVLYFFAFLWYSNSISIY